MKEIMSVREIAAFLEVKEAVFKNYLYGRKLEAKLDDTYEGDALKRIFEDYSKTAYLRTPNTIEKAKEGVVFIANILEKNKALIDVIEIGEDIADEIEERQYFDEYWLLKAVNAVSMLSAMTGIFIELKALGVLSLGLITSLFLIFSMRILKKNKGHVTNMIAFLTMAGIEVFWAKFHVKTFSSFDSETSVFGENTSLVTACVIGGLSFICLVVQSFEDGE